MKKLLLVAVAAIVAVLAGSRLYADDFPSRPITLVNPFGPGSASDTLCRIIADPLGQALRQPVVVEDRPGADGALAALYVHHQPADGYNLLMATNSPLSADPFLHKDVDYDAVKDFAPITRVGSFTLMLVVDPNLPIHSVKDLVAYAKANPGKLIVRQRQYRRHRRRRHARPLGRDRCLASALQEHAAGARRHHRRTRLHDVRRFHHRHATRPIRRAASAGDFAHQAQLAVPGTADA